MCVYLCIYIYICNIIYIYIYISYYVIYIYIYTYIQGEREIYTYTYTVDICICLHIYIYIYREREREIRARPRSSGNTGPPPGSASAPARPSCRRAAATAGRGGRRCWRCLGARYRNMITVFLSLPSLSLCELIVECFLCFGGQTTETCPVGFSSAFQWISVVFSSGSSLAQWHVQQDCQFVGGF